jgi:hypothetical protein
VYCEALSKWPFDFAYRRDFNMKKIRRTAEDDADSIQTGGKETPWQLGDRLSLSW